MSDLRMEKDAVMVTIPTGYVAIPMEERDNLIVNNMEIQHQLFELNRKVNKLKELCCEEALSHKGSTYHGSIYTTTIADILGFELSTVENKGDE